MDLEQFKQGFAYDAWANERWIAFLAEDSTDAAVMAHLLGAQLIWLLRCQGTPPTSPPPVAPTIEEVRRIRDAWLEYLAAQESDRSVSYHRFNGEPGQLALSEIVRHVLNHGTYHRGELRGLCRARGIEDFPETDLALFLQS